MKEIYEFLSAFPSVKKGESVFYVDERNGYARIITGRGEIGWIPKKYLEE